MTDNLLARYDPGAALARDLEATANLALPSPSDIDGMLDRFGTDVVSSSEAVAELLSLDRIGEISVEGMRLNELLAGDAGAIEERKMLQPGLLFLRRRKYAEAVEWWTLHRNDRGADNSRAYLLLTLLLALTFRLAGDEDAGIDRIALDNWRWVWMSI
jgi:hypothetical protein